MTDISEGAQVWMDASDGEEKMGSKTMLKSVSRGFPFKLNYAPPCGVGHHSDI